MTSSEGRGEAETYRTVHRSLWSSPGSFLKSHLPLSERRKRVMTGKKKHKPFASQSQRTHVCFPTSSLSIRKAGRHPPLKNGLDQWLSSEPASRQAFSTATGVFSSVSQWLELRKITLPVNHFIGGVLIKGVVESERLVL